MFGSEILEIALGLVLVFLLMSLVLTAVQEAIEAWLRSRAGDLNRAIFELLQNDKALLRRFYDHPLIFALHRGNLGLPADDGAADDGDYQRLDRAVRKNMPSYIPRETFAAALLDMIESGECRNDKLNHSYGALSRLAGGDLAKVRAELESWYDGAMDRASGWFKRRTQVTLFGLGLAAALLFNVNAFVIARHLATDEQSRIYATRYAERITADGEPTPAQIAAFQQQLESNVGLPIGWSATSVDKISQGFPEVSMKLSDWRATLGALLPLLTFLGGYLATAFAMMLGAPFWFDVLNRVMVIRSTVKPKEKSPDEPSEDGGKDKFAAGKGQGVAAPGAGNGRGKPRAPEPA